jgi:large subunit ribosomal protein L23
MKIFKKNKKDEKEEKKIPESIEKKEDKKEQSTKELYEESKLGKIDNKKMGSMAYKVLIKPIVTEKAANLNSDGKYVFMVARDANKIEVAKAIQDVYGVKPVSVNIIKVKGKRVNRGRISGKRKDIKKAVVSLKKGDSISIYEGV